MLGIDQSNENTALVRFRTITYSKVTKNDKKSKDLQAVIKWEFKNVPTSLMERDENPLGFCYLLSGVACLCRKLKSVQFSFLIYCFVYYGLYLK